MVRSPRILTALATSAVLAVACGNPDATQPDVVVEVPDERDDGGDLAPIPADAALELAAAASFAAAQDDTGRVTPAGVVVDVDAEYFEPVVLGEWTAPDECAYDTLVTAALDGGAVVLESGPLSGPRHDDDRDRPGVLGSAIEWRHDATGVAEEMLVALVVFDHDGVVTLALDDEIDTQPADGWTPLVLTTPATGGAEVVVDLSATYENGDTSTQTLSVPVVDPADGILANLTPAWAFDAAQVGEQCVPPVSADPVPVNTTIPPETDLLGGVVGDKPELPAPGEQPADPAAATSAALLSIRTVYDIYNLYDPAKHALMEDPAVAAIIFAEAEQLRIVEPFIGALDPIFDSLVFTSPTEASVLYQVGPGYHWEVGRVMLIDGTWRVALGTLCRDLNDAGYQCDGVISDPRPGPLG